MKGINGFNEVEASSGEFERMPAGAYVCKVINAEDFADKEYLRLDIDVAEGEWTDTAKETYTRANFWPLTAFCSYKSTALQVFKGTMQAFDKSNNTTFEGMVEKGFDESLLEDKFIGVIFCNEHYIKNNGELGERLKVKRFTTVYAVHSGKCKVPEDVWTEEAKNFDKPADSMSKAEADNPFA